MSVEVRILGPIEVLVDGTPARLGGSTQRELLGLLVVHAGEFVPRGRLHDELWPDADPARAARNVKSYVFALRKSLGAAARLVQTRPGGYLLDLDPEQLDATRFERLAREGKQALADGQPARAAELLRSATALWRGAPLSDLADPPFAAAAAGRLAALRLDAVEDRIEADLALGGHAEVVAELEALVEVEPLRERPAAQLMIALYRSGRQADALEVFARTRGALLELGLEPGPALRDVQVAILRHDPALEDVPPARRRQRSLPTPTTRLVGRRRELDELGQLVRHERVRLITLTGPGGVGKTRLALDAARELAEAFADGAAFVQLAPLRDAALVPAAVAEALQVREQGDHSLAELLVNDLRTRHLLLVLDNFEHVDVAAPLAADLLAAAPGLVALVTSRTPLRLYGEYEYQVRPLALEEAVPLFVTRARAAGAAFDEGSQLVEAVCSRLDCLPLAIELVAARAPVLSVAQLGSDPLELASGGPRDAPQRQQTLRATIDWSHDLLADEEQILFRRLSVFADSCAAASAHAVCGGTPDQLAALVADSLLVVRRRLDGELRFQMLVTIRDYARERLLQSGEADAIAERHARHFLELVEQVERELDAGGERAPLLDRLTEEHDNLRTALAWAHESGPVELELRLAASLRLFWHLRGHLGEGRAWLAAALAREDEQPPQARAKAAHTAGVLAYLQGDLDETERLASESLALFRMLGDEVAVGRALSRLGVVAATRDDFVRAVALYEEAVAILREHDDSPGLAPVLGNLGDAALKQGEFDRAAELLDEAAELQRAFGDVNGRSLTLFTFATALTLQGELDRAADMLEESLALAAEIVYPEVIGYCLAGLGKLDLLHGKPERATRRLAAAATTFERIGAQMQPFERGLYDAAVAEARRTLGEDAFTAAWTGGERLALDQAAEEARSEPDR